MEATMLKIKNLHASVDGKEILKGINLEVKPGEIHAIMGPNGAGKSTTIRTLLGLIKQNSGKAEIFGMDTLKEKKKILEDIGYLPS